MIYIILMFFLVQPCSLSLSLCDLMCFRFFSGHVSGAVTKTQQVAAMHSRTLGPLLAVQLRQLWFCSARSATHGSRCACGTWGRPHARPEYSAGAHNWSTIDISWSTGLKFFSATELQKSFHPLLTFRNWNHSVGFHGVGFTFRYPWLRNV